MQRTTFDSNFRNVDVMSSSMQFRAGDVTTASARRTVEEEEEDGMGGGEKERREDAELAELWLDLLLHGCSREAGSRGG